MRILIDTGVLFSPGAIRELGRLGNILVLPATAYAERLRQLEGRGLERETFDTLLGRARILVEPFGVRQAQNLPPRVREDSVWRRLGRDALICAHMLPGDILWTTNPKDFLALGVPKEQIHAVA